MKVNDFLLKVYKWLCEPQNRFVEDWHYEVAEMSNCRDMEELKKDSGLRYTIRLFLKHRAEQFGLNLDSAFISRATTKYITNMYS